MSGEAEQNITHDDVVSQMRYNEETGNFYRFSNRNLIGTNDTGRYITIRVGKYSVYAHRLAFFYIHKRWPKEIDHINRVKSDNRWKNIRECSRSENNRNLSTPITNTSGCSGVTQLSTGVYVAKIWVDGKNKHLASTRNFELAKKIRFCAEIKHGFNPKNENDHKNLSGDMLEDLILVAKESYKKTNTGYKGVGRHKDGVFVASARINGKTVNLGRYDDIGDAIQAVDLKQKLPSRRMGTK